MSSDNAKHPYSSSERRETLPQIQEDGDSSEELTFEQYRQRKNASGTIPYNLPEHNWKVDLKTVTSSPKDEKKRSSRKIHVSPRVDKKISQRSLIGDSKAMLNVSINDSVDIPRIDPDNSEDKDKYVKKQFIANKRSELDHLRLQPIPDDENQSGVDSQQTDEEKVAASIRYKSRNTQFYDDSDSQDHQSDQDDKENRPISGINFLKSQQQQLKKEIERNEQLLEIEQQKLALGANSDFDVKPNKRFKNFNDVFSGLTKSKNVPTAFPIVSCIITYNSKSAITVTVKNDREYWINQYSLETYFLTFEEKFGGKPTSYIKLKEVEQNSAGTYFAVTYIDDGQFKLRTFGEVTRTQEDIDENELDINSVLGINNYTMPIDNFPDPFITCTFVSNDLIFINLFHSATLTHYHFFYNWKQRETSGITQFKIESNDKNFPFKCFYNEEDNEVYSFYRQGQSFRIPVFAIEHKSNEHKTEGEFLYEKIYDKDLGQMFLIYGKALVVRCSSQVLFFKLTYDDFLQTWNWKIYNTLELRGFIYYIKGNVRIQVCTDQRIYFYLIDRETLQPQLENVMFNFMNCSQMMFGSRVRYGITFKTNQRSFDIYRRKFEHDFCVNIFEENLDRSKAVLIDSMNAFIISKIDIIRFFDVDSFEELKECQINIPLFKSEEREPNEIIGMQVSKNQDLICIISGKNLIMNEQKPNQLFVFKREKDFNKGGRDLFKLLKRIVIKDNPFFAKICMQFHVKNVNFNILPNTIIFAKPTHIFELNYETEETKILCEFEMPLLRQPEFFIMNEQQNISVVASIEDGYHYNHSTNTLIDLDMEYKVCNFKSVAYDSEDKVFYVIVNKYDEKLGVFLIKFDEQNPYNFNFFLKYKNKLDISNAHLTIVRNNDKKFKELVVSYKTIFINTYNVRVIDISSPTPWLLYTHESFQLWESQVQGLYLTKNMDFITINKVGINLLSLGSAPKRSVQAVNGQMKMIHSLESTNYLKIDAKNLIQFQFAGDIKVINITQQYIKKNAKTGDETCFEDIYSIRIHTITLRELLLFQSLYVCNTLSDILQLVQDQPRPAVFFKSFLELDSSNMTSILSFDSRSMKHLLQDSNQEYFQSKFPLFYKNKIQKSNNAEKYFYRSALDSALRNNQVSACEYIIDYIIKYQNNYVSSFLFIKNFGHFCEKGLKVSGLLNSNIFCFQFDYDEWPSTHTNMGTFLRPYNQSIFDIRQSYREVFWEKEFEMMDDEKEVIDSSKVYKVTYTLNTLAQLGEHIYRDPITGEKFFINEDVSLMQMCFDADELDIFDSENFQQLIHFKWKQFAKNMHLVGCIMHFFYVVLLISYVNNIYIRGNMDSKKFYEYCLVLGVLYPMSYDLSQLWRQGITQYFSEIQNYSDQMYIWCSVANVISQNSTEYDAFHNKVLMSILLLQQIVKTFFFLRIFQNLSYIVTMINTVVSDLQIFLLFFTILQVLFSMVFAVLGVGNKNIRGGFKDYADAIESGDEDEPENFPNEEYENIGLFLGYLFQTLRTALGDFDFEASQYLTSQENYLYWFIWLLTVVMTTIIFLNFIIAEASASYEKVKLNLTAMINKEQASLIAEAEGQFPKKYKDDLYFPKYIVIRQVDH